PCRTYILSYMQKFFDRFISKIPYIRYAYWYKRNSSFRPGHYYSPVVDLDEVRERQDAIWARKDLPGIDLNEEAQKEFLTYLLNIEPSLDIPLKKDPSKRYSCDSLSYPYVDGVVLQAVMLKYRPKNIIEVGSG